MSKRFAFLIGYILLLSSFAWGQASQTFTGTTGTITDNNTWKYFSCNVSGLNQTNINTTWGFEKVTLSISHNNDADLEVHLLSPDGTDVLLFNGVGGTGNNFTNTGFKNTYTTPIASGSAPFNGSYLPQEDLGVFNNGQNGNGNWYLKIRDTHTPYQGSVTSWSIRFGNDPAVPLAPFSSNLPIVKINTHGQSIPDDPKIAADFQLIYNGPSARNYLSDTLYTYSGNIGIERRGSSSGSAPKKSYGFETWDSINQEIDTGFLGLPPQSDWILNANYYDKTLMRNVLSYQLFNNMDHYAPRTRFCEVFLNGQYLGVYALMEKIKRDPNRVDIAKLNVWDTTGDQLTGGYIVKIDKFTGSGGDGFYSNYPPSNTTGNDHIFVQYEYPNETEIQPAQKNYIQQYMDSFETALFSSNYQSPAIGFRRYAGERTFMDYMFLNELSKNVDGYRLSTYFYKDKQSKGGKLKAGPAWDYDIAWMNANYCEAQVDTGWAFNHDYVCAGDATPAYWERMMTDTLFREHARCRWFSLRLTTLNKDSLYAYIDSTVAYLNEAQQRNFVQWPILGVATWPEPTPLPQTYMEEIQRLKGWINDRLTWLDAQFNTISVLPLSVNIGADTALCTGNTVVLYAGTFDKYQWSTGHTQNAIQVNHSGSYKVTVSDEFGCTGLDSANILFYPLPAFSLGNDTAFCDGNSIQLSADSFSRYRWNTGDSVGVIEISQTGIYSLTVTDSNGCEAADTAMVYNLPLPDATFTWTADSTFTYSFHPLQGGAFYEWNFGDGDTSTTAYPTHIYQADGSYVVELQLRDSAGCAQSSFDTIAITSTGMSLISMGNIQVFPNPFTSSFTVQSSSDRVKQITMTDITGRIIYQITRQEHQITALLPSLPAGMYLLRIETENRISIFKLMKAQ